MWREPGRLRSQTARSCGVVDCKSSLVSRQPRLPVGSSPSPPNQEISQFRLRPSQSVGIFWGVWLREFRLEKGFSVVTAGKIPPVANPPPLQRSVAFRSASENDEGMPRDTREARNALHLLSCRSRVTKAPEKRRTATKSPPIKACRCGGMADAQDLKFRFGRFQSPSFDFTRFHPTPVHIE